MYEIVPFKIVAFVDLALMLQGSYTSINAYGMVDIIGYGPEHFSSSWFAAKENS